MPTNPRMTKTEKGLLKGAINRVFSRSELRARALEKALVKDYSDPSRNRVTRWFRCTECKKLEPAYLAQIDHIEPRVPIGEAFENMSVDVYVDRTWCDERLLQPLCKPCHTEKSSAESKQRKRLRDLDKPAKIKKGKKK